jgi:threonine dehydrogenase-like Zn-dependent dehydrogenase
LGVDFIINLASEAKTTLAEITSGDFPTVVMDATGNSNSMGNALNFLSHGGRLVYLSGIFSLTILNFTNGKRRFCQAAMQPGQIFYT